MKRWKKRVELFVFVALSCVMAGLGIPAEAALPNPCYVNINVAGGNESGDSWVNASKDLKGVMAAAVSGDTIWVAKGTYSPGNLPNDTFLLKQGVEVYGGFSGVEGNLASRNWRVNRTILDGNDRNYHVVTAAALAIPLDTRLDGFTVTGGRANGSAANDKNGGGMYIYMSAPMVENCFFSGNRAEEKGGGMFSLSSVISGDLKVSSCTFSGNAAKEGGGMYCKHGKPTLVNCTFAENKATQDGGGLYNEGNVANNVVVVVNCTFSGNSARKGGGMFSGGEGVTSALANTILWGNYASVVKGKDILQFLSNSTLSMNHCVIGNYDVEAPATLVKNALINQEPSLISQDVNSTPTMISTDVYVYALGSVSSALDSGLVVGTTVKGVQVPNVDQLGTGRAQGGGVDIGAFEKVFSPGGPGGPGSPGDPGAPGTPSPTRFFIHASWDVGGSIRPRIGSLDAEGRIEVAPGGSVSFDIIPNTGRATTDIRVDGKSVDVVPVYEFKNVMADHWIWASFRVSAPVPPPPPVVPPSSPDEVPQEQKKSSGGGGCDAGWGCMGLFLPAALLVRRRR